tara:strand:+ start:426 stop:587 length:162 start_codon:yes stop_codon:yes gene_type:complete
MSIKLKIKKLEWRLKNNEWTRKPYLGTSELRQNFRLNKKTDDTAAQKFKKRYT